jgi:hypothetical protein
MRLYSERNRDRLYAQEQEWLKKRRSVDPNYPTYNTVTAAISRKKYKPQEMEKHWKRIGILGLTWDMFQATLFDQDYACKICKTSFDNRKAHADHDHKTGKFRGILCTSCNMGLGVYESKKHLFELYLNEE